MRFRPPLLPLANEGIQGELLESASVRGCYVYDYRIQQDRQPTRHLRTLVRHEREENSPHSLAPDPHAGPRALPLSSVPPLTHPCVVR